MKSLIIILNCLLLPIVACESIEAWVCDKICDYNVPDPIEEVSITKEENYFYLLGRKDAYKEVLKKVREIDIINMNMNMNMEAWD